MTWKTATRFVSCWRELRSRASTFLASSSFDARIRRICTKARMISTLTITARSLRRTLESMATPLLSKRVWRVAATTPGFRF